MPELTPERLAEIFARIATVAARSPAMSDKNEQAWSVYFILAARARAVKIGVARDPDERLADFQTAHPDKLHLVAVTMPFSRETAYRVEKELHEHFADSRLSGEWFAVTDKLRAFVRVFCGKCDGYETFCDTPNFEVGE